MLKVLYGRFFYNIEEPFEAPNFLRGYAFFYLETMFYKKRQQEIYNTICI